MAASVLSLQTGMLNERGGYEADVTVTRVGENEFYVVSPTAQATRDMMETITTKVTIPIIVTTAIMVIIDTPENSHQITNLQDDYYCKHEHLQTNSRELPRSPERHPHVSGLV